MAACLHQLDALVRWVATLVALWTPPVPHWPLQRPLAALLLSVTVCVARSPSMCTLQTCPPLAWVLQNTDLLCVMPPCPLHAQASHWRYLTCTCLWQSSLRRGPLEAPVRSTAQSARTDLAAAIYSTCRWQMQSDHAARAQAVATCPSCFQRSMQAATLSWRRRCADLRSDVSSSATMCAASQHALCDPAGARGRAAHGLDAFGAELHAGVASQHPLLRPLLLHVQRLSAQQLGTAVSLLPALHVTCQRPKGTAQHVSCSGHAVPAVQQAAAQSACFGACTLDG